MKLSYSGIADRTGWENAGVKLPSYNPAEIAAETRKAPVWLHFGAGNIFRGYIAALQDTLLGNGDAESGIIAAESFDYEIIDKIYTPFDNLALTATLCADGTTSLRVVGSLSEGVKADSSDEASYSRLKEIFRSPSLQMVSFTVTEKGYGLNGLDGAFLPVVADDIAGGPAKAKHIMSVTTAMLFERFSAKAGKIAVVSMDNCSHNGEKLRSAVLTVARAWTERGFTGNDFLQWVSDENEVSFPWTMIDKITPRPSEVICERLASLGIESMAPVVTSRKTFIAPFVNTEKAQYLVIEDRFPNGRPALEKAGVYFTDRETVNKVERMKVTTCLNPLHTALAVYGCLLGYKSISAEMNDAELSRLVRAIGYDEGLKVVTDPLILSPREFIDEVVGQRLPNPFIPDTPQRIATDTSQKIAIRFGETIKAYSASPDLDENSLVFIPLAIAGWLRYLLGVDDNGDRFERSPDPMLADLAKALDGISLGNTLRAEEAFAPLFKNKSVFGADISGTAIAAKITAMFKELASGEGAVRATLRKYCGGK